MEIVRDSTFTRKLHDYLTSTASVRTINARIMDEEPVVAPSNRVRRRGRDQGGRMAAPGRPFRRYIQAERTGPFYREETRRVGDVIKTVLVKFYRHRFLHATKGWREFANGTPQIMPMRRPAIQ